MMVVEHVTIQSPKTDPANGDAKTNPRLILVTGATGKDGQAFIERLLTDPAYRGFRIRALCHNRVLPTRARLEVVRGSIDQQESVTRAMVGVSHVLHLATPKETPESI